MNDEWSRCPICFEDYSPTHRPTTFICGHSTCINHAVGSQRLLHCPICRHPLRQEHEYHISYSLEEASRFFQLIKNTIDWSTIKVSSETDVKDAQNRTSEMIHRDELYARQLQAELNRETTNGLRPRTEVPRENQALPVQEITTGLAASRINMPNGHMKNCGHRCELVSNTRCCTCSDQRPHRPGNQYGVYVDGRGIVNEVGRNRYYCPSCKSQ